MTGHNVESLYQSKWRTDTVANLNGSVTMVMANSVTMATVSTRHRWAWGRQLGGGSAKFRPGGEWFLDPQGGEQVPPF